MLFSPRIRLKPLAALCRRQAMAQEAGIDLRTLWAREAGQARGPTARQRLSAVSKAINQGETLSDALAATGDFFPELFRQTVGVGEQSGHLAEVFEQLAGHYESQIKLRRSFLSAIAWPVTELVLALAVVGLLIWVMGFIAQTTGTSIDVLGFGLVGNAGLAVYLALLAVAGGALYAGVQAVRRGVGWTRPIQLLTLRLPVLGPALETLALARLAWSMELTMNAGMPVRQALRLSLASARNARYTDRIEQVDAQIEDGNSIYAAFCLADCFPPEFLDAVHVGEQSGSLVESMGRLSRQYQEQARAALATLAMLAGVAVWVLVAAFIIVLIFRVFSFYVGAIKSAIP